MVHCQKKTTKKHYALKVQTKLGLIETYRDDSARLDMEKQAYASCQHPFIINLDYAFQSEQFVFMALALCTCNFWVFLYFNLNRWRFTASFE